MIAVGMMQVAINEIVYVVAVRNRFMTAPWSMHMPWLVACTSMVRDAGIRIRVRHLNRVLVNMIPMGMVQMAIVQVINVTVMLYRRMTAVGAMFVGMIFVNVAAHVSLPQMR